MTVMLYKPGTKLETDLGVFDYIIVEADDVAGHESDGWCLTQTEAICPVAESAPTKRKRRSKAQMKEDVANGN